MEISTKFAIGDKVWVLVGGRPKEIAIGSVTITGDAVTYREADSWRTFPQEECFPTEEELNRHIPDILK